MTNDKTTRAVIFARVSTTRQSVESQVAALREVRERKGWEDAGELFENGVSGRKGRKKRPGLQALITGATRRDFDVVMVFKLDRLGRSTKDVLSTIDDLREQGIELYIHDVAGEVVDTRTAMGRFFLTIAVAFGELESGIKSERIRAGLAVARAKGTKLGRARLIDTPGGPAKVAQIRALHAGGMGKKRLADEVGVALSTVRAVLKGYQKKDKGGR